MSSRITKVGLSRTLLERQKNKSYFNKFASTQSSGKHDNFKSLHYPLPDLGVVGMCHCTGDSTNQRKLVLLVKGSNRTGAEPCEPPSR